jgi:release factor glutamine methyltransferase
MKRGIHALGMTVADVLALGVNRLKNHTDTPALDARLLLADILRLEPVRLLLSSDDPVCGEAQAAYEQALERRLDGECVAYITGSKEFWGLPFLVNPSVLVPRPDTETLVEAALTVIRQDAALLELCTGSGAVAIALKKECPALSVKATDISAAALETARKNAARLQADVCFAESDLFDRITGVFDLIVANPPYIPTGVIASLPAEVRREPRLALDGGEDGLDLIKRIIAEAKRHLKPAGVLLMEASPPQMPAIAELLRVGGYQQDVRVYQDIAGLDRVIGGTVCAAAPPLRLLDNSLCVR